MCATQERAGQRVLGRRYRLIRLLGRGGMGSVWLGHDEMLGRDVAVKKVVLPAALDDGDRAAVRERTLREARAAARISHPNVVTIYDVILDDHAQPWIVMSYVAAGTLQQLVSDQGPLPPARVAMIGLDVLEALRAAHRTGVLHRDVKPSNILVRPDGRAVLTDFGIATISGDSALTHPELLMGAPAYLSPERARGLAAGPPADLWGLGACLFFAVEGRPVYERGSALETVAAMVREEPEPPRHAGPLRPAIEGLLRKDPDERITIGTARTLLYRAAKGHPADRRTPPLPTSAPPSVSAALTLGAASDRPYRPGRVTLADPTDPSLSDLLTAPPGGSDDPAEFTQLVGLTPADQPTGPMAPPRRRMDLTEPISPVDLPGGLPGAAPRRGRSRHRLALVVGLACLALLAVAGAVVFGMRPGPHQAADRRPSASASGARASGSASPSPSGLPAGFVRYTDPTGFSLAVPAGWTVSHGGEDGHLVFVREPAGNRFLMIDHGTQPKPDPVADWTEQEQARRGGWPAYHRIRIVAVPRYFVASADWEFTYTAENGPVHVVNRGTVTDAHNAYGMFWSTPAGQWSASLPYFSVFTSTFRPAA
jgi:serine/threonine protein kinase